MNTANVGLWTNALERVEKLRNAYNHEVMAYHSYEYYDAQRLMDLCEEVADLLGRIAVWLEEDVREVRKTAKFWRSQFCGD